ncbi:4307_t:CDS:2 [Dentiscutata heterogama]|uniref:4307_t:CDS:1 n=1 Tax=Dentiscutata heterogama TaxID=1316150 RepID=A0ACA9K688_9GLOM|nr:4307_t:CDS:2 [Dentiscutata heterogama]
MEVKKPIHKESTISETSDESSRKRYRFFLKNANKFDSEIEDNQTTTAIIAVTDTNYFNKGTEKSNEYYEATFNYCRKKWSQEKSIQLEAHLSNDCANCSEDIGEKRLQKEIQIILEGLKKTVFYQILYHKQQ